MRKGYWGIGIENGKYPVNYGTLFRTAQILNADFCFVIGSKFKKMVGDTMHSYNNMPIYNYKDSEDFLSHLPINSKLISVEMGNGKEVSSFKHPKNAVYVLGNEKDGVSKNILKESEVIKLHGENSMNVSVAGSIVMYDRFCKMTPSEIK